MNKRWQSAKRKSSIFKEFNRRARRRRTLEVLRGVAPAGALLTTN